MRFARFQSRAPEAHASYRDTTWSIWTAALVFTPRLNAMPRPVYGSANVPDTTRQEESLDTSVRSRARIRSLVVAFPQSAGAQPPNSLSRS